MDPSLPPGTTGFGAALVQTLVALAVVCAVAYGVLRGAARRGIGLAAGGRIRVLDRAMLDARRSVYLVQVGRRVLLLGGGDQSVTVLAELREEELPEAVPEAPRASFAEVLDRLRGRARSPRG